MAKFRFIVLVLILAGAALFLGLQYSSGERLRRENESLKLALAELKRSRVERELVSNDDSASKEQLDELLSLRGEVTQLRQQTNQIAGLKEANQKLLSSVKELESSRTNSSTKKSPPDALPQDIHPKATWAYRGFGTPEATVESVLSAMINGDKAACLAGFSPEMKANIEKDFDSAVEHARADDKAEFRVLDRQALSEDEMVLTLYMASKNANGDVDGHSEKTVFDRIGGEWKVTDKHVPSD